MVLCRASYYPSNTSPFSLLNFFLSLLLSSLASSVSFLSFRLSFIPTYVCVCARARLLGQVFQCGCADIFKTSERVEQTTPHNYFLHFIYLFIIYLFTYSELTEKYNLHLLAVTTDWSLVIAKNSHFTTHDVDRKIYKNKNDSNIFPLASDTNTLFSQPSLISSLSSWRRCDTWRCAISRSVFFLPPIVWIRESPDNGQTD